MAFIPVPGVAQFNVMYDWQGEQCENTLYFAHESGWTFGSLALMTEGLSNWAAANISPLQCVDCSLVGVRSRDLTTESGLAVEYIRPTALPGGGSGSPALPHNVSCAISFRTNLAGRSYRGRNYILALMEVQVFRSVLDSGIAGQYVDAYQELHTLAEGNDAAWVVASRYHLGAPRDPGISTPVVSHGFTDRIIDSQRRRLPGRGR